MSCDMASERNNASGEEGRLNVAQNLWRAALGCSGSGFIVRKRNDHVSRPGIVELLTQDALQFLRVILDSLELLSLAPVDFVQLLVFKFQLLQHTAGSV